MNHRRHHSGKLSVCFTLLIILISAIAGCDSPAKTLNTDNQPLREEVGEISRYLFSNPSKAIAVGNGIMATAPDSSYYYGAKSAMALAYVLAGKPDSARIYRNETERYLAVNPQLYALGELHNYHLAIYYNIIADMDSCILYASKAHQLAMEGGYVQQAIVDLSIVGEAQEMLGRPIEAASVYRRAIAISDSLGDPDIVCHRILIGLAATYSSIGNYDMADKYFDMTGKAIMDMKEVGPHFIYYSTLGTSLYNRERYRDAIDVFHKAYVYADSLKNINFMGVAESNLGECHMLIGNLDSAEYYLDKAEVSLTAHGELDTNQQFYLNSLKGDLSLRKGYVEKAFKWLQKASKDTLRVLPRYAAFHYNRLARYYTYIADYITSIEYLSRAKAINDSIKSRSAYNYTAELECRYAQDTTLLKSHMRLTSKTKEVNFLRALVVGIILLVVIIVLIVMLRIIILKRKHTLEAMRLSNDMQRLRMENISNRISSHFIFNLLNGVDFPDNDKLRDVSELIRQNLELSDKPLVTLREELDFIDQYIKVERPSLGHNFTYTKIIDRDIDLDRKIPAMMLEIFVENSIKHGLRGYEGEKRLTVSMNHTGQTLVIEIVNNGNMVSRAPGTGTGLRVISQTVHLLNISNRNKIQINQEVDRKEGIYRVTIRIPDTYTFSALFH